MQGPWSRAEGGYLPVASREQAWLGGVPFPDPWHLLKAHTSRNFQKPRLDSLAGDVFESDWSWSHFTWGETLVLLLRLPAVSAPWLCLVLFLGFLLPSPLSQHRWLASNFSVFLGSFLFSGEYVSIFIWDQKGPQSKEPGRSSLVWKMSDVQLQTPLPLERVIKSQDRA